jgi:DNA-binding transcriptional ArsR family regulator
MNTVTVTKPLLHLIAATSYSVARRERFDYDRRMKTGPDIAMIAALVGDPARCNMLTALMSGRALTASELAQEAGVTPQTASSHLAKLESGLLITPQKQGRHRYYRIAGPEVAAALESLMVLATRAGVRVRTGPKDPALRRARVCYDHLAGSFGVRMLDAMTERKFIRQHKGTIALTPDGERFIAKFGIDLDALQGSRRPLCKTCLDWSARRSHLAGTLGAAMLARLTDLKWAQRDPGNRIVTFTPKGESQFAALFGAPAD